MSKKNETIELLRAENKRLRKQLDDKNKEFDAFKQRYSQKARYWQDNPYRVKQIVVTASDDIVYANLGGFACQLLDTLPVQIYVKDVKERRYVYLNAYARLLSNDALYRTENELVKNPAELKIFHYEDNKTIKSKMPVGPIEEPWTAKEDLGFRCNRTTRYPIILKDTDKVVGVVSIAEDIKYFQYLGASETFMRIVFHEINNLNMNVHDSIEELFPDRNKWPLQVRNIKGRIASLCAIVESVFKGWRDPEKKTVGEIVSTLEYALEDFPADIKFQISEQAVKLRLPGWGLIIGILAELIRNGEKWTSEKFRKNRLPKVDVKAELRQDKQECVEWTVSNQCDHLAGVLTPKRRSLLDEFDRDKLVSLGYLVIGDLLAWVYPYADVEELFVFEDNTKYGHVDVKLTTPSSRTYPFLGGINENQ